MNKAGINYSSSKIIKKINLKNLINVNLFGDKLYKVKIMFNGIVYNQGLIKNIKKVLNMFVEVRVIEITSNISFKKTDVGVRFL